MSFTTTRPLRSDAIKKGIERAPHRSLLRATGVKDEDFDKPFIAIANSYIDIIPGHVHLDKFGQLVKDAVRAAGGVPFIFNTIAVDDGIAMGHFGMKYSLPSREIIADSVETVVQAHQFDALVCIPNCDKIVPGMLMAAMRCNIPTIFISGGPMYAGQLEDGTTVDLISVFEAVGAVSAGTMAEDRLLEIEQVACPTCGSCSGMFTANSMNCLCEAIGLALPGNGTLLALDPRRHELWKEKYPNRQKARGIPFTGIENARPETKEIENGIKRLRERLPFDPLEFMQFTMPKDKRLSHRTDAVD